ncbi:MAG: ribonuclease D [Cryobacterium sp.]|nr:ribonuclease D [Cryobacterium sp.]
MTESAVPDSAATRAPATATEAQREPVDVIDTREEFLAAVAAVAAGTGSIALDAERASGYRYSQRAYLIQLYRAGTGTLLFDPPAVGRFDELNEVIRDEEWVLHAASQDLPSLREVGLEPTRIFDTELGARLAGLPRVGLGAVLDELLGVHLAKAHSAADWSTRPLPQPWLVYAALDVDHLIELRDAIGALLSEQGKAEIAAQEFAAVLEKQPKPPLDEPWRRLSGLHSLRSPRAFAIARALWVARDEYAQEVDTSPGRLLPDASLVAAAGTQPTSRNALSKLQAFTGRASRTQLTRWWAAIEQGMATDDLPALRVSDGGPPPARAWSDRNPEADRRLRLARAAITDLSAELAIPVENLLTPENLRRVAWSPPEPLTPGSLREALAETGAREWQLDATTQLIHDAFVEAAQTPAEDEPPAS